MSSKDIVLAFSGGLDTSFCIPYLQERGYAVHTVLADTGGVDAEERDFIEKRAAELGAASHVTVDGDGSLWSNTDNLLVGAAGQGTLEITSGAFVHVAAGSVGVLVCGKRSAAGATSRKRPRGRSSRHAN